jgi:tetratricopeptide (TPR) repeat protein
MVLRVEGRMPQRLTHLLRTPDTDGGQIASLCLDIIKEEPSRVDAYLCLGALAIHEGRTAEGLSYLRQAIDAAPSLAHPLRENAAALLRIEDYERASASLAQAIAIDPNDARSRLLEGLIALQQDQPIAAMAPLRRAQELDPYDPHAALVLATALQRSGKDDEAIAELTRALNRVPPHRSVMLLLARARAQHALARTRADSAPEATLSAALADAVLATKRTSTARERAEAEYHRGVILIARHSKRAATRALDAAILHDPSLLGARQALAALRESGDDDANARLLRRAAYLTMILATAITALFVIEGFLTAKAQGAHFHWTPVGYLVLVPIVVIALTGLLPRVARIRVRELEITIAAPPSTPETTWTTPDFGRTPLSTMWGPSTYRASDIVSDLAGLPEWG